MHTWNAPARFVIFDYRSHLYWTRLGWSRRVWDARFYCSRDVAHARIAQFPETNAAVVIEL